MVRFILKKKRFAFTLIELSIVIAIITILASISIPNVSRYMMKSRDAKRLSDMQVLTLGIESFYDDRGHYPGYTDDNDLDSTGECIGVGSSPRVPTSGPCNASGARDGALDALLRTYIQGPIPRDPLYDNRGESFYYVYDPFHDYYMPRSGVCGGSCREGDTSDCLTPHANLTGDNNNTTAVLGFHRFEVDTINAHQDVCTEADMQLNNSDYNIAFPDIGYGNS